MTEKGEVTSAALQLEAASATTNDGSKDGSFFNHGKPRAWRSELMSNLRYTSLLTEASGSMGDLGTFVPIVVALTLVNGLDLGTSLIFTGVYNILTGLLFGVPMPVQPMKSIAAVAISQGPSFSIDEVMAAGILTAAVLFGLGVTGLMGLVQRFVPLPVVRGIQLSQGLAFAITAVKYVLNEQNFSKGKATGDRPWLGLDGLLLALVAFAFIALVTGSGDYLLPKQQQHHHQLCDAAEADQERTETSSSSFRRRLRWVPTAMVVFVLGVALTFVRRPGIAGELRAGPTRPRLVHITRREWRTGFVKAAVPQIPLSVLNSVVAVCKLSHDLYPDKERQVSPTAVSASVGLMNLVGCWFGALPVCHGAGGLAGQWRFGARSGAAVVMLGSGKLLLGLVLGNSLVAVLKGYPVGLLGVLLFYAGVELSMACRDQTSRAGSFVVLAAAAVSIASSNATMGFVFSLVVHLLLTLPDMTPAHIWASFCAKLRPPTPAINKRQERRLRHIDDVAAMQPV